MPRLIGAAQTTSFATLVSTFNSSGTFTAPPATTSVDYLIVAGGGGGGAAGGGGGGAGGFRTATSNPVTAGMITQ
jgi:hypothetical protein